MKKWFALLLACILALSVPMTSLAETVVYPSITVTFKAFDKKTEEAFRVWASSIINNYLTYANGASLEIAGHGFYDHFNEITRLINEYDLEDTKVKKAETWFGGHTERKYTSLKPYGDEEESAEMRKYRKQVFMKMIAETMQEKCVPSSSIYSDIQKREIGRTMVYDSSKGRFVYSSAYTYMDGQDSVAFADRCSTLVLDAGTEALNTVLKYYGAKSNVANASTVEDAGKLIAKSLKSGLEEFKSAFLENLTKEFTNLTNEAIRQEIAECISMADESIVKYITKEWIDSQTTQYGGMDQFHMTYGNDVDAEILREAAQEAIALYKQYKGDPDSEVANIQKELEADLAIDDLELQDWDKILNNAILTTFKEALLEAFDLLIENVNEKDPYIITTKKGGKAISFAGIIGIIKGEVESFFDAYIESNSELGALNWNDVMTKMRDSIGSDMLKNYVKANGELFKSQIEEERKKKDDADDGESGGWLFLLEDGDKFVEAIEKTFNGDPGAGKAWSNWIFKMLPSFVNQCLSREIEAKHKTLLELLSKVSAEYGEELAGEFAKSEGALNKQIEAISVIDVNAWMQVGAELVLTIDAAHDDRTNKSQASFTSTELYIALKSVSLRQHNALKALLTDNANAAYDSCFGPQNVLDPKLTSTEGIAAILCKIFTEYNTNLTALGAYKTLVNGNSDVMEYIRKHSKKQGGFPFVSDKDLDVCIKVFSAVNSYKEKQSSYAQYF